MGKREIDRWAKNAAKRLKEQQNFHDKKAAQEMSRISAYREGYSDDDIKIITKHNIIENAVDGVIIAELAEIKAVISKREMRVKAYIGATLEAFRKANKIKENEND